MTLTEARKLLKSIRKWGDPESCHGAQDDLLIAAVEAVIAGHDDAEALCLIAKQATMIPGARWYA